MVRYALLFALLMTGFSAHSSPLCLLGLTKAEAIDSTIRQLIAPEIGPNTVRAEETIYTNKHIISILYHGERPVEMTKSRRHDGKQVLRLTFDSAGFKETEVRGVSGDGPVMAKFYDRRQRKLRVSFSRVSVDNGSRVTDFFDSQLDHPITWTNSMVSIPADDPLDPPTVVQINASASGGFLEKIIRTTEDRDGFKIVFDIAEVNEKGLLNGQYTQFNPTSELENGYRPKGKLVEGQYENGVQVGVWTYFTQSGNVYRTETYNEQGLLLREVQAGMEARHFYNRQGLKSKSITKNLMDPLATQTIVGFDPVTEEILYTIHEAADEEILYFLELDYVKSRASSSLDHVGID